MVRSREREREREKERKRSLCKRERERAKKSARKKGGALTFFSSFSFSSFIAASFLDSCIMEISTTTYNHIENNYSYLVRMAYGFSYSGTIK
jgi:hypothetical protein